MQIMGAFDRKKIADLVPRKNSVLISITNLDGEFPKVNQNWTDILRLKFDDITDNNDGTGMVDSDAKQVLDFAIKHIDKDFFINCDAGLSRSPAIVVVLEEIFNSRDVTNSYPHYNKYVRNKTKDVWFKTIWKKD